MLRGPNSVIARKRGRDRNSSSRLRAAAGRDERRQRQPREVVAGQEALAGEVAVAVEVGLRRACRSRCAAARAAPRPRARSRFGLLAGRRAARTASRMIAFCGSRLARAPRGRGSRQRSQARVEPAGRPVQHRRRASRRATSRRRAARRRCRRAPRGRAGARARAGASASMPSRTSVEQRERRRRRRRRRACRVSDAPRLRPVSASQIGVDVGADEVLVGEVEPGRRDRRRRPSAPGGGRSTGRAGCRSSSR